MQQPTDITKLANVKLALARAVSFYKANAVLIKRIFYTSMILILTLSIWRFSQPLLRALKLSLGVGWKIVFLPILFLIWNFFATLGWKNLIQASSDKPHNNFRHLYIIRIQAQALNFVLPVSGIGGEALRSTKTARGNGLKKSTSAVILDKITDIIAETALAIPGLILCVNMLPFPRLTLVLSCIAMILIIAGLIFWQKTWSVISRAWPFEKGKSLFLTLADNKMLSIASRKSFLCHFAEHALIAAEIYAVSLMLGINLDLRQLLIVNTVSSAFNLLFIMIPGRIGAFECSMAFAFSLLSLPPATGVSVALIRRARQILVCMAGILFMLLPKKVRTASRVFPQTFAGVKYE